MAAKPHDALPPDVLRQADEIYRSVVRTRHDDDARLAALRAANTYIFDAGRAHERAAAQQRFATAYARSGESFQPDLTDDVLAEIADKAAGTLRRLRDAMRTGTEHQVPGFLAAITDLLATVAATRAAFGFTDTPTGREIVEQMRAEDVTTPACDALRLHLTAVHCNAAAAGLTDREAREHHHDEHHGPGGLRNHPEDVYDWTATKLATVMAEDDGDPVLHRTLREHMERQGGDRRG